MRGTDKDNLDIYQKIIFDPFGISLFLVSPGKCAASQNHPSKISRELFLLDPAAAAVAANVLDPLRGFVGEVGV